MDCVKCKKFIDTDSTYCKYCGKKQIKTAAPKPLKRANGTGTVYHLSGRRKKPWTAAINKNIIGYYEEKNEAVKALEAVLMQTAPVSFNQTVSQVYERWKTVHFRDLTDKGREGYVTAWARLTPLHNRKMRDIKTVDFQRIVDSAMKKTKKPDDAQPLSRSGKEKIKQVCSQICKQAIQDDIINRNYAEFIKLERIDKKEKEVFSKADIDKLFENDSETARIILTLIYTGFRINELLGVKLSDVKFKPLDDGLGAGEVSYIVGGEKTEAGKNRIVPISLKIRPFVSEWVSLGQEYLICNSSGGMMDAKNFRNRRFYPLLEQLDIDRKTPHATRHTFATLMASAGARPEDLQKIIGHASYATTAEIYVHPDIEQLQKSIDLL